MQQDEFEKKYDDFLEKLFYVSNKNSFHKLKTKKDGKEFGIFRNEESIVVKAITEKSSEISYSKDRLIRALSLESNKG